MHALTCSTQMDRPNTSHAISTLKIDYGKDCDVSLIDLPPVIVWHAQQLVPLKATGAAATDCPKSPAPGLAPAAKARDCPAHSAGAGVRCLKDVGILVASAAPGWPQAWKAASCSADVLDNDAGAAASKGGHD